MAIDSQVLQQASNPNTPPEQLRKLADCDDATIRQLVVANPNTPTKVLWHLGKEFPAQLLENPVLPLLFLEHINLIQEIPQTTLIRLFEIETVPDYLQQGLLKAQVEVRVAIALNPNTPLEILKSLGKDNTDGVRRAAGLQREAIAANPNTPVQWLEQLVQDPEWTVRRRIAQNPNTPVQWLEQLAQDPDTEVRRAIAENSNTPVQWLERLAQDLDTEVRWTIAQNINTPVRVLKLLAQDPPERTILQKIKLCQTVDIKDWKPKTEHAHFSTLHTKITDAQILIASLLDLGIAVKTNADVRGDNSERVRVDVVAVLEGKYDIDWSLNSDRTYDLIADLWGIAQKHNQTELINSINQKYAINKAYADSKKRDLTNTKLANKCLKCNSTQIKKYDSIQGKQNYKCQKCGTEFQ